MEKYDALTKKNILFNVLEGSFFMAGMVFFHQQTILVAFIKKTFDSPVLVALVPALFFTGYNLPGLFITRAAEQFKKRKKFVMIWGAVQRISVLFMALSTLLMPHAGARIMALTVLIFYTVFTFCGGFSFPAWIDFYAKTVPLRLRARTTALRNAFSGIAGILLPLLVTVMLSSTVFPLNYGILFFIGFIFLLLSFTSLINIEEKEESPVPPRQTFVSYLASLLAIIRTDRSFREFIIIRIIWSITACAPAFYIAYAIDLFHITDSTVAFYTFLLNSSIVAAGLLLGYIGDKWGNFKVQALGAVSATVEVLLVIFFPSQFTFGIVFFLSGITNSANMNAVQVVTAGFGSAENRIRYSTLVNFISGSAYGLTPMLAGLLLALGWLNMQLLFMVCAASSLLVLLLYLFRVREPGR